MTDFLRPNFWKNYPLAQLNRAEWEALCDGCGLCCLVKLEDQESHKVVYTKVACQLLDCTTGQCSQYDKRHQYVPDCIELNMESIQQFDWLPSSCAYKRRSKNQLLPAWHYLNTGSRNSVKEARKSVAQRCISELNVAEEDLADYIVKWVK